MTTQSDPPQKNQKRDFVDLEGEKGENVRFMGKLFLALMETTDEMVYACSDALEIVYMNPSLIEKLGRSMVGEHCRGMLQYFVEGKTDWIEKLLENGKRYSGEHPSPTDGNIYAMHILPYEHSDGSHSRIGMFRDITEWKKLQQQLQQRQDWLEKQLEERTREIEANERQRAEVQKLAALGEIAAGVAHEINNPLASVRNAFYLIRDSIAKDDPNWQYIEVVDREITRMRHIILQMYNLYQPSKQLPENIDMNQMVQNALLLVSRDIQRNRIDLRLELSDDLPRLFLPVSQVMQILINPIKNAIEAIKKKEFEGEENGEIALRSAFRKDRVFVEIEDNGCGIDKFYLSRVFEPFATTKRGTGSQGMGLGLPMTRRLINSFGGSVNLKSQLEIGTTVHLEFPLKSPGTLKGVKSNDLHEP